MTRRRDLWLLTLLTLIAFALRLADLTARSLWLDESFTLLRVNGTWAEIIANTVWRQGIFTTDLNPPLYFALLKAWSIFAGLSEFALKSFSAFGAVIVVPLTFVLARDLFGRRAALIAAVLAVLCPAYQWYAAELRMYTMMAALGALSTMQVFRATKGKGAALAGWLVVTALSIFTHFSFISLAIAHALILLMALLPIFGTVVRRRGFWVGAAIILAGVVAIALIGNATIARGIQLAQLALYGPSGRGTPALGFLNEIIGGTVFGLNAGDPTAGWLNALFALLVVMGAVLPLSRRFLRERIGLAIIVATPIAFWLVLSRLLENGASFRYVVFIVPALHVLMAHGVVAIAGELKPARWPRMALAGVGLAALLIASLHGLSYAFTRTPTFQDDWRSFGNHIRQNWQAGDALVINLNTPEAIMPYVLRDAPVPVIAIREWIDHPVDIQTEIKKHSRIWYANTGGDGGYQNEPAQNVLASHLQKKRVSFPARTTAIELIEYDIQPQVMDALPANATPVADVPAQGTSIAGYAILPGNPYNRNPNFKLSLFWRRGEDDLNNRAVTIRLAHNSEVWLDWTSDAALSAHPESWTKDALYQMDYLIPVAPGLPMVNYEMEVLSRAGDKGEVVQRVAQPLPQDALICCVRVVQTNTKDVWQAGDVALAIAENADAIKPGEAMPIALTWRPVQNDTATWQTELRLDGLLGGEVASVKRDAGVPDFPPPQWPANELVRDQYALQIPYSAAPGVYRLSLSRWRNGAVAGSTMLGFVRILDYERMPVTNNPQHPVNGKVGEIALLGYSMAGEWGRGKTHDVFTHWRVDATPQRDGVLFLHVMGPSGQLVSQDDNPPLVNGNARSTLTYRAGDGIDQLHRIELKPDLPAGEYTLYAGIYDREGGARWPAQQGGQPAVNDLVKLGAFTLP
jgi:4-amino-4-deoxy-L-arabinose transferase-like glycosyltransferase